LPMTSAIPRAWLIKAAGADDVDVLLAGFQLPTFW
jgi:hypothetical protein